MSPRTIKFINITLGVLLLACFLIIFYDFSQSVPDPIKIIESNIDHQNYVKAASGRLHIVIKGEVANPGRYEINAGSLIIDAIEYAGGFTENADMDNLSIDLATIVGDEMMIEIPAKEFVEINPNNIQDNIEANDNYLKIDINKASIEDLVTLKGIGPVTAQKIIDYRQTNRYDTIEEIKEVKGIGDKTFADIKDNIKI